jgi:hypothetical protein
MKMGTQDSEEMPLFSMFVWGTRKTSLPIAALMIALIAAIDAHAAAAIYAGGRRRLDPLGNSRSRQRLHLAGGVVR